jgi:hypothetical protein
MPSFYSLNWSGYRNQSSDKNYFCILAPENDTDMA